MTKPQHQPKEYIITEEELVDLYAMTHGAYEQQATEIHQRVHSRPSPAPSIFDDEVLKESASVFKQLVQPEKMQCPYSSDDDMCLECKAHEERIARQARSEYQQRIDADAFLKKLWEEHIIHPDSPEGKYIKRTIALLQAGDHHE